MCAVQRDAGPKREVSVRFCLPRGKYPKGNAPEKLLFMEGWERGAQTQANRYTIHIREKENTHMYAREKNIATMRF